MAISLMFRRDVKRENFAGVRKSAIAAITATSDADNDVASIHRDQNRIRAADLLRPAMLLRGLRHADQHPVWQQADISCAPRVDIEGGDRGSVAMVRGTDAARAHIKERAR